MRRVILRRGKEVDVDEFQGGGCCGGCRRPDMVRAPCCLLRMNAPPDFLIGEIDTFTSFVGGSNGTGGFGRLAVL